MEACLHEELAPPTELEESLRNGVVLAKLGHCFAPDLVPLKKIYDREQLRYKATGLHFRHTDNINYWRDAMTHVGLPSIFHPETTDIYDKKNMPRVVYCIHALSLYLFKLGLAPQIQDLYGKVDFTEEEINNMKRELEKYGLQLPAFSKIGGLLANELSVDEAAVHAAVLAINEAVERGAVEQTMEALRNPNAMLLNLREPAAAVYQEVLYQAKLEKASNARNRAIPEGEDIYDRCLTQAEIQGNINKVNVLQAVSRINAAVRRGTPAETLEALMDPAAQLPAAHPLAAPLYQRELALLQRQHPRGELTQEELFVAVEMLSAVALVNRALEAGDPDGLWSSLVSPALGLADVEDANAQRYFDDLLQLKAQSRRAGAEFLSWNDVQASVSSTNSSVQNENTNPQVLAVRLINEALLQEDPEKTLAALLLPAAGLTDVTLPVARRYHHVLTQARRQKAQVGAVLWWEEIQQGVSKANEDSVAARRSKGSLRHWELMPQRAGSGQGGEGRICRCRRAAANLRNPEREALLGPARAEGRRRVLPEPADVRGHLGTAPRRRPQHHAPEPGGDPGRAGTGRAGRPVAPQGAEPAHRLPSPQSVVTRVTAAHDRERLWAANAGFVVRLQARARGYLVRRAFAERRHVLREQWPAATRIQVTCSGGGAERGLPLAASSSRSWAPRPTWDGRPVFQRALTAPPCLLAVSARNPPLSIVRRFIHLLEQSQHDFWEESELLRLREEVVKRIRASRQLESDLDLMDIKIGLLVKNRITLQEVVSHCKKLTKKNKEQLSEMMAIDKQKGLKSLSKEKRQKLEAYQHLFYLLQTQPGYLARLIFQMPQNKSTKFMESVIFTLYNYASNPREAYLLLQLFKAALQEEIRSKVDHIHDILRGNPTVIRLVVSFYRNARGQNALRQILGGAVQEVLQDKTLSIRTNPVDIYKAWINQTESQSGQKSKLPYEVSPEQALSYPEVQRRLDISIRNLLVMTDKFVSAITSSVDKIPYGMRYVAKILKTSLAEKFPEASEEEIYKIVGNLLYYRFMNPAVVAPDGFDIVDISAGVALHPDHRRNLGSIAKVLQHAAAHKAFDGENAHLRVVNCYLEDTHDKFRWFISAACCVPELEERFNMDEYSEMVAVAKPVIYITVGELINTHKLLLEHQDSIAPLHGDPLHELLEDLDEIPTVQSLLDFGGAWWWMMLAWMLKGSKKCSEYTKQLMGGNCLEPDFFLISSTKQMLVDVIQSQPGDSLLEILRTPASEDEEASHSHLMHRRALRDARTPDKLQRNRSLAGNSQLSMGEKKRKVIRNLRRLESLGVVDSADEYQGIVNEMAKDIRNQRRYRQHRKGELLKLRQTLQGLNSKTLFYEEQIDYYNQYIKTCLDNLAASNKASGKNKKLQSLHYTAARLFEKGVLLEIEDLPVSQFRNVIFDIIPCEESGKFQVKAKFMGIDMEKFQLHYQDLLQLQYEGVAVMKMFDKAKVNVNLLIFLLNKKFFKK
uniref:IQ motif containing GTPase activating protein 3 n=1 Tax=Apteryx owenii TaxID=8824 RepID=A0A8B9QGY6_APTOW